MQPGMIDVCSKNYRHPLAALPAIRTPAAIERLTPLLGECVPKSNVLEVALHNPNLSIHTVGTILNASRIQQTGEDFALYKHGFTEAVWNIVLRLDAEKMAVMRRVGGQPTSYFEEFVMRTFVDRSIDPMKGFEHYANEAPKGPSTIWTRYVTEDVPVGLGLLDSLGKAAGIPTPTADAVIHLAGVMHDRDYYAEARTMQVLWPGTLDGLLAYVQSGKQA
jgi:opine dehydrogenase